MTMTLLSQEELTQRDRCFRTNDLKTFSVSLNTGAVASSVTFTNETDVFITAVGFSTTVNPSPGAGSNRAAWRLSNTQISSVLLVGLLTDVLAHQFVTGSSTTYQADNSFVEWKGYGYYLDKGTPLYFVSDFAAAGGAVSILSTLFYIESIP